MEAILRSNRNKTAKAAYFPGEQNAQAPNENGEKLNPLSLVMPALGIAALAFVSFVMFNTTRVFFLGSIPVIAGVILIVGGRVNTGKHLGWQLGLTAWTVIFSYIICFGAGLSAGLADFEERSLALLLTGVIVPAIVNTFVYRKVSKSWKTTAALMLCDLSMTDVVLIGFALLAG